jgi:adenylate cyclase
MPNKKQVTRKLSAILSADVKGYSVLMADDEIHTINTLKAYRQIISDLVSEHSGRVVDSPGDNILAEFRSSVDAVDCAVKIQNRLKQENSKYVDDKRVQFRIGVNIGDVIQDGDRIYGNGVNVAARIEGLAEAGGVCISRNAYDHIKNKLTLGYEYIGEHSVKNITDPVRVYKLLMADEDAGKLIGDVPKPSTNNWIWATVVMAVAIVAVFGTLVYQKMAEPDFEPASIEKMTYSLPEKPSIAVLPFRNMSGDPNKEYIADGLTENIITNLAKLPQVFVISRESSFFYKGKNIQISKVSEELGVRYVLEGSVIVEGDNVRATAQLIDGLSGHHVWAQNYDRELEGLLALLDDITLSILKEMQVEIRVGYKEFGAGTQNISAYLKLVEGRYLSQLYKKEENLRGRKLIEEAIELDPYYAEAYVYLGATYILEAETMWSASPRESKRTAVEFLKKAIAMNDNYWVSHTMLALCIYRNDPDRAVVESKKALALAPGAGLAYIYHARFLTYAGKENRQEIKEIADKGRRLSPYILPHTRVDLCTVYLNSGDYNQVIALSESLLEENYHLELAYTFLILGHLEKKETEKAQFYAKKLMEVDPDFQVIGLMNFYAIKLSTDADDLIGPVKHILYPNEQPFKTYSYDKKPKFRFKYPSSYKGFQRFHPDISFSLLTPKGGVCYIVMTRLTPGQTLNNFWSTYMVDFMNNFGSAFEVKKKENIILDCGTEARLIDVDWRFQDGTYWSNRFVYTFRLDYGIFTTVSKRIDDDDDLSWIDRSLTFQAEEQ